MERIKYSLAHVQTISYFEQVTRSRLRDLIDDAASGMLFFVVEPNELGRALGKGASNVKRLEEKLHKRIRMVEFDEDKITFIGNLCYPVRPKRIDEQDGVITITAPDHAGRGMLIGRGGANLRSMELIAKRYFPIREIKVPAI